MQQGQNSKNLNNSCYIYRSACNFLCSAAPAALFFSHSLSPPSSNCPVRTDISIAQKTCEFRPVDISVSLTKCNKLIYQSVYSLLETMVGVPLPSAHCVRSHLPQGDGFLAVAVQFPTEAESCLPGSQPSPSSLRDATSPERGRFCSTYRQKPCLRGFNPRKKAAALGAVQRLV
mgnify:CR=1 FL=1